MLDGREFDATIDVCAYVPVRCDRLAEALGGRGGHHVFVSTMSVYDEPDEPGMTEDGDLLRLADPTTEEVTGETYGGLKVLCEQAAAQAYGDATDRDPPTYVIGPHDYTGRFTWWVRRIAEGGRGARAGSATTPRCRSSTPATRPSGPSTSPRQRKPGIYNSISPTPPFGFGHLLDATVRAVGPDDTELVWADGDWLKASGRDGMTLPLWTEGEAEYSMAADPTARDGRRADAAADHGDHRRHAGSGSRPSSRRWSRAGAPPRPENSNCSMTGSSSNGVAHPDRLPGFAAAMQRAGRRITKNVTAARPSLALDTAL